MFAATRRVSVLASHLTRTATTAPSIAAARAPTPAPLRRIPSPTATLGALFSTAAASPVEMSAAKTLVDEAIKDNDVLVFSKSYCPYCHRAKSILGEVSKNVKVFELDEIDNGSAIQQYLKELNGQGTVPHVYIKQQFIGGCSDLQAIPHGELVKRISA